MITFNDFISTCVVFVQVLTAVFLLEFLLWQWDMRNRNGLIQKTRYIMLKFVGSIFLMLTNLFVSKLITVALRNDVVVGTILSAIFLVTNLIVLLATVSAMRDIKKIEHS